MSVMRLSIIRAETGISWILKIVLLLGKSSNKTSAQLRNASFINKYSVSKWFSMLSNALCSFVATFGCSICPSNHFVENAALLFVAR